MSKRSEGTDERDHKRDSLRDSSRDHSRDPSRDPSHDPWRALVNAAQIPEGGLHREIEADAAVREAMADLAGVREISSARASFDLTPDRRGRVHVAGTVRARIGQTCVVTLDPIDNEIDETVDVMFAPSEQIPHLADLAHEAPASEAEIPDGPEPIVDGVIDLGRLATDVLLLAIDPYPRKPGVVFEPEVATADPEDHPFAALKALQLEPKAPDVGKPKGK
jgi:Large ribosomal RNA subunit accumulation protein YceD